MQRLGDGPIIAPSTCRSIGTNIQGPSLVAAPPWIAEPLGAYYLYFADHKGAYIRLAYADDLQGPWSVHRPGSLQLETSGFLTEPPSATDAQLETLRAAYEKALGASYSTEQIIEDALTPHIASPDVHLDQATQQVVMYFHGLERLGRQVTRVATSSNGIGFVAKREVLGGSYFRVFEYDGWWYSLVMPGQIMRSRERFGGFELGPTLFEPAMRHSAVRVVAETLEVFWTRVGDAPESILRSEVDLRGDWMTWTCSAGQVVLRPEQPWEGSLLPAEPSQRGAVHHQVNQLRDPCVFVEDDVVYLLYSGGGEAAIGLAKMVKHGTS